MRKRAWFYGCVVVFLTLAVLYATSMPGRSHTGPLPPATPALTELQAQLRSHVTQLARGIGVRTIDRGRSLHAAEEYVVSVLTPLSATQGGVALEDLGAAGGHAKNVIFEVPGRDAGRVIVVGAHYDSADGAPGANDNASGVASALELARRLAKVPADSRVRFVFFANEEPPFFKNPGMGSRANADNARKRGDPITAMLALETLGHCSSLPGSQHYPWPVGLLYPSRGDFVAFVGNLASRSLVRDAIGVFRGSAAFPSEGAALPTTFPGVDWSDHWSFWQAGYPALLVTDTALYRDPNYHQPSDTPEKLDYDALARVTVGLEAVVRSLAHSHR